MHSYFTKIMSINYRIEIKATFPFYIIYTLQQNLPHNDLIHIYIALFSINILFVQDWNVSYKNIAMVYINITTECGQKCSCTLAL